MGDSSEAQAVLNELYEHTRGEFPEDDAKRSAEQLKGIIHDTDGATAQAKLASQLFDPQRGVLHFLKATTDPENSQDRSKSREHVLKGLAEFVERAGPRCEEAAPEIFLLSLRIFKVDQTNSVKQAALEPMKEVLKHRELFKWFAYTLKRYTTAGADYKRFHVLKGVLAFLSEHADVVQDSFWPVVEDALGWLLQIAQMPSRDVRKLGWSALVTYVRSVATILTDTNTAEEEEEEEEGGYNNAKKKEICTVFVQKFLKILTENWQLEDAEEVPGERKSGLADTSLPMVIRALGQFAKAIKKYFGNEELRKVLQELIEYAQVMFIDESGESINPNARAPDIESHLSEIMTALAQIIKELPAVDDDIRTHVDTVVGKLMELFPRLPDASKKDNCKALWTLVLALDTVDFHISEALIDVVVREAVDLAVSRKESTVDDVIVKYLDDYVEFFQQLLHERNFRDLTDDDARRQGRLARRVYDGLIERVLNNFDRLDLTFRKEKEVADGPPAIAINADPTEQDAAPPEIDKIASGMEELGPNSIVDYEIYLEHVELCTGLLPYLTQELFTNWAHEYTARIARLCEKDETACRISGHYKLMQISFQLCAYGEHKKEGFFEDTEALQGVDTRQACKAEFLTFVQRASTRMTQFKDELLVAAVQSVISVPLALLEDCIGMLVEPVRLGLELGVSYMPLAEYSIGRLECWLDHSNTLSEAPAAAIHAALEAILPGLDGYLYVSAEQGQLSTEEVTKLEETRDTVRRAETRMAYEQRVWNNDTSGELRALAGDESLCRRVLRFLGQFGGHTNSMVGTGSVDELASVIAWDRTERVKIDVPFPNSEKPSIYLDKLLPRIVELAEGSSDRKTKVSACELLHAVVLHYVASNTSNVDKGKSSKAIYGRLFPALLRLSVDGETVARNLFEPLMRQLITWFTDPGKQEQGGIDEMLEAVADAVCHPTNSTLREAAAGKFALVLKWSLKQYGGRSRGNDGDGEGFSKRLTIDALFTRIFHLAEHPDPYKRIGASLAFRQLANEMTNHGTCKKDILEEYLFAFVERFLTGLRLSEKDSEALEAASLATKSIRYCVRVFKHRSDCDFRKEHPHSQSSLAACVELAFIGTGDSARAYREVCTYLFMEFVGKIHVSDAEDAARYNVVNRHDNYLQEHPAEGERYLDGQGWATDRLRNLYETEKVLAIDTWDRLKPESECLIALGAISSCACGYKFLLQKEVCRADGLLGYGCKFMNRLERWIRSFADCKTPGQFAKTYQLNPPAKTIPKRCQKAFAQALLDVFDFLTVALDDGSITRPEHFVENLEYWLGLALMCLTHPVNMSFVDAKQQVALRDGVGLLLATFGKTFESKPGEVLKSLYAKFAKDKVSWMAIKLHKFDLARKEDYANLLPVIMNHGTLMRSLPDLRAFFVKFTAKVFSLRGRTNDEATAITIDPGASTSDVSISKAVLEFCLESNLSLVQITEAMIDAVPAESGEVQRTRGEVFCDRYEALIRENVLSDDSSSLPLDEYVKMLCENSLEHVYLFQLIDDVIKGCVDDSRKRTIVNTVVGCFNSAEQAPSEVKAGSSRDQHSSKRMSLVDTLVRFIGPAAVISSQVLMKVFLESLDVNRNKLSTVEGALKIVPWFISAGDHDVTHNVITKLEEVCSDKITCVLDPQELMRPGKGRELAEYVHLLDELLSMLKMCNSIKVVQLFYPLLMQCSPSSTTKEHFHKDEIHNALESFAANRASPELFQECWCETRDPQLGFVLRLELMDYVCVPMIQYMHEAASRQAIAGVIANMQGDITFDIARATCSKLESGALACSLLEAAYRKLLYHIHEAPMQPDGQPGLGAQCKQGTKDGTFLKSVLQTVTKYFKNELEMPHGEDKQMFLERRKQFHTRAFRLVANALVKTQTKPKLFDGLILKFGETGRGDMIWKAVVGTQDTPEAFTAESTFATQNIQLGLLREQTRQDRNLALAEPGRFSSQFVEGSSLANDVGYTMPSLSQATQPDTLSASMDVDEQSGGLQSSQALTGSPMKSQMASPSKRRIAEEADDGGVVTSINPDTMMELDPLNQNPCMDATMRVVRFRFAIPLEWEGQTPVWIESLEGAVSTLAREMQPTDQSSPHRRGPADKGGSRLVLLYMVKVIMNTTGDFAPYAMRFLRPMVQVACTNHANGGNGIHYFVRDICTTLLRWVGMHNADTNPPTGLDPSSSECIHAVSRLVSHLITHILSHELRQTTWKKIFHANLSLIQDFVETFKPTDPDGATVTVQADIIASLLIADDEKFKAAGIQVLSLCLKNDVNVIRSTKPFVTPMDSSGAHMELQGLYPLIIPLLGYRRKTVQGPAAEVLAEAMAIATNAPTSDGKSRGIAWDNSPQCTCWKMMRQVHQFCKGTTAKDSENFVYALYKLCSGGRVGATGKFNGFPRIASQFYHQLLNILPRLRDENLTRGISVIVLLVNSWQVDEQTAGQASQQKRQEKALATLTEFRPWVNQFLRQRNYGAQLSMLKLLCVVTKEVCVGGNKCSGAACPKHDHSFCADNVADQVAHWLPILCQTYSTHKKVKCREIFYSLIIWVWESFEMERGPDTGFEVLAASRAPIQQALIQGLADEAEIIRAMVYQFWNTEERLKEGLARVPQLLSKVYMPDAEENWTGVACSLLLQTCEDGDSWENRPYNYLNTGNAQKEVDVQTWSGTSNPLTTPLYASSQSLLPTGMVEATQDMAVDLSQTFARSDMTQTASELAEETVMQVVDREKTVSATFKRDRDGFKMPAPRGGLEDNMAAGFVRFQKKRGAGGNVFVVRAEKKRKREATLVHSARSNKRVRMLRKYREGERPDFGGLQQKDIFAPLRDLALKDRQFSRLLMDTLFAAVTDRQYVALTNPGGRSKFDNANRFTKDVVTGLCGIMQSTNGSPTVVGWLLGALERFSWSELSLNEHGLTPNQIVARIGQLSLQSSCYHSGIKALESLELRAQYDDAKREDRRRPGSSGGGATMASHASGTLAMGGANTSTAAASATAPRTAAERHELYLQLGNIYRALGDEDAAIAVWSKGADIADPTSGAKIMTDALHLEITQKYKEAKEKYKEARAAGADAHICDDGMYACCARLQQWGEVTATAGHQLNQLSEVPAEDFSRFVCGEHLDRFLRGYMKTEINEKTSRVDIAFLSSGGGVPECFNTMHPLPSAALALYEGDRAKAEVNVDSYYNQFVTEWSTYHKLAGNVRLRKLRGLQKAVEMEETMAFLASLNRMNASQARGRIDQLLSSWRLRLPQSSENTEVWADLLTDRQVNLAAVERRLSERNSTGDVDGKKWNKIVTDMRAAEDGWCREIAELAADRAEADIANKHRTALHGASVLIAATLYVRKEQRNTDSTFSQSLTIYSKGLSAMSKRFADDDPDYAESQGKAHVLKAELCAEMTKAIYRIRKDERDHSWADGVDWPAGCEKTHSDPEWQIHEACEAFKVAEEAMPKEASMQADVNRLRCKFATFCRESLEHARDPKVLANTMVQQLLQAMAGGSKAARMSFPSVLTVLEGHPSTIDTFARYAADVPIWMFLIWCRQIISRINQVRPESDVLITLLVRLATEYPQTVYYPFQLCFSDFDKDAQRKTEPLKKALATSCDANVLGKFVRGLGLLNDPWSRALGWYDEIETAIGQNRPGSCKKLCKEMHKDLFRSLTAKEGVGPLNRQFAKCNFGQDGVQKEMSEAVAAIRSWNDETADADGQKSIRALTVGRSTLKREKERLEAATKKWVVQNDDRRKDATNYSTFLAKDLPLLSAEKAIEVPGLWDGFQRPDMSQRVTLAGFQREMMPLKSIRAPKKVTFHGSDDRDYPFLAKGGEDLRLDERLEQLFAVMNAQLRDDPEARARQLHIPTFAVTPVSKRAGVLQWCQNTSVLGEIMGDEAADMYARYDSLKQANDAGNPDNLHAEPWTRGWARWHKTEAPRKERDGSNSFQRAQVSKPGINIFASKFLEKGWQSGSAGYTKLIQAHPDVAGKLFTQAERETPKFLLKARLLKLAPSAEAYLQLRSNCARTMSTSNIAGYIAGVGDRHMGNFLLDETDGSMIGIDFGYSFGVPQLLPVPELAPFRLSPQLLQCFDPLDGKACITQIMSHTMRVLRQNSAVLTSVMRIFLDEPLIDWQKNAHMQSKGMRPQTGGTQGTAGGTQGGTQVPKQMMDAVDFANLQMHIVDLKLLGKNPMMVITEQLENTKHSAQPSTWEHHKTTIKGKRRDETSSKHDGFHAKTDGLHTKNERSFGITAPAAQA